MVDPIWLSHARGELGVKEVSGDGDNPRIIKYWNDAGCSEAEAWEIIRDRDCARHGALHELIDTSDLPDRWFRDAWRRSSNCGPPSVDLEKARPIQWRRLMDAVSQENKRREYDLFGPPPIELNKIEYQAAISRARDDEELRKIWHSGLSLPLS